MASDRRTEAGRILRAAAQVAELLLLDTGAQALERSLRLLGEAVGVSRVYVFENHPGPGGVLCTSQRYEWAAPGVTPQIHNPHLQNFPWVEAGFGRWVERMSRGEPVFGLVEEFPPSEQEILRAQDILSLAAVPIFVGGRWWGFVGFDDCAHPRRWTEEELSSLQLVSRILSAALEANRVRRHVELTADLGKRLLACRTWQELAEVAFPTLRDQFAPDGVTLFVVDPTGTYLELVAGRGWQEVLRGRTTVPLRPPSANCVAWAVAAGSVVWVPDLDSPDVPFEVSAPLRQAGVRAVGLLPLVAGGSPVGCVVLDYRTPRPPSAPDPDLCERTRTLLTLAVEGLRERLTFQDLFHRVPVGLYRCTPEGAVLAANRFLAQLVGLEEPQALVGRRLAGAHVPEEDWARWRAELDRRGEMDVAEAQLVAADGRRVWVRQRARAVFGPAGEPLCYEGVVVDLTEQKRLAQHARDVADRDPLTGLLNRDALQRRVDRLLQEGSSLAVLVLDLNGFEAVNRRFGMHVGDRALRWVARTLQGSVRAEDLVGRVGGDRFAVVVPATGEEAARQLARRILKALQAPADLDGVTVRLSGRCGVALADTTSPGAGSVLQVAEAAVREAKATGLAVLRASSQFLWGEDAIRQAMADGTLTLAAQPILDLRSSCLDRWEVLLRLRTPSGLAPPGQFLRNAEQAGMMPEVDAWVLQQAFQLVGRLPGVLHVNLSPKTLADPAGRRRLFRLLRAQADLCEQVTLEVTETAVLGDLHRAERWVRVLRRLGTSVVLDDFGVGYSSVAHLQRLDVDAIKLDGTLVRNVATEPRDRHLVASLVDLAHRVGCVVIAEWVEDLPTLHTLRDLGVDGVQGYYVSPPAPVAAGEPLRAGATQTGS
jgi:diguanylate cyclase (GGDEF)-like protein/PAS domain S-box-containing protein